MEGASLVLDPAGRREDGHMDVVIGAALLAVGIVIAALIATRGSRPARDERSSTQGRVSSDERRSAAAGTPNGTGSAEDPRIRDPRNGADPRTGDPGNGANPRS